MLGLLNEASISPVIRQTTTTSVGNWRKSSTLRKSPITPELVWAVDVLEVFSVTPGEVWILTVVHYPTLLTPLWTWTHDTHCTHTRLVCWPWWDARKDSLPCWSFTVLITGGLKLPCGVIIVKDKKTDAFVFVLFVLALFSLDILLLLLYWCLLL